MRVLVACEESQEVCKAFRAKGHEAYSCDLITCSGGHPEWHIQDDAKKILHAENWDIVIAHPPCDRLCKSGVRWLAERNLWEDMNKACDFFIIFQEYGKNGKKIAIENPVPHRYAREKIGYYHQKFQPWHFGHKQKKETCLWLYNLPPLMYTNIVGPPLMIKQKETNGMMFIERWATLLKERNSDQKLSQVLPKQWLNNGDKTLNHKHQ